MSELSPGTPCFICRSVQSQQFNGRVVEVVAAWPLEPEEGQWYQVDAEWVRTEFPDSTLIAERANLLPIIPPDAETTKHTEEAA